MSQTTQLESADPQIRIQAIEGLAKIGGAVAIQKLVLLLIDTNESVRERARTALDEVNPEWMRTSAAKNAVPALEAAAHHDNYWVGLAANAALKLISGGAEESSKEEKTTITDRFFYQKREAARLLASALKDSDADFRLVAAETLGRIGNVGFVDALAGVLNDPDEWVRWHAAHSLQAMGWETIDEKQKAAFLVILRKWEDAVKLGGASVDPLIFALKSSNSKVREAAATALGKLKEAKAELPLADCLQDKQKSVRRAAAKSLVAIGPKNLNPEQRSRMVEEARS